MNEPAPQWVYDGITVLAVIGFILSGLVMLRLLLSFILAHEKVPFLLWRDALFWVSLMGVIVGGYIWLFFGYTAYERPWWWTVLAGVVTINAAWIYVTFTVIRFIRAWRDRRRQ